MRLVRVAVPVPSLDALTYKLPDAASDPPAGARVLVALGNRVLTGVVLGSHADPGSKDPGLREPGSSDSGSPGSLDPAVDSGSPGSLDPAVDSGSPGSLDPAFDSGGPG